MYLAAHLMSSQQFQNHVRKLAHTSSHTLTGVQANQICQF